MGMIARSQVSHFLGTEAPSTNPAVRTSTQERLCQFLSLHPAAWVIRDLRAFLDECYAG